MKRKLSFLSMFFLLFIFASFLLSCCSVNNNLPPLTGLDKFRMEVLNELNFARTQPKKYAETVLQPRLPYFNGNTYSVPGQIPIITHEGAGAVTECINELNSTSAIEKLSIEKGLNLSAQWLADDQARTGQMGHTGSDGSNLSTRINRYGKWSYCCAENCAYGTKTAREIVAQLLIDDGVSSRGHRKNILNPKLEKVGIGYNDKNNAPYGAVTVQDFAGDYVSY